MCSENLLSSVLRLYLYFTTLNYFYSCLIQKHRVFQQIVIIETTTMLKTSIEIISRSTKLLCLSDTKAIKIVSILFILKSFIRIFKKKKIQIIISFLSHFSSFKIGLSYELTSPGNFLFLILRFLIDTLPDNLNLFLPGFSLFFYLRPP